MAGNGTGLERPPFGSSAPRFLPSEEKPGILNFTPIQQQAIIRETVRKEDAVHPEAAAFSVPLSRVEIVAEKPTARHPGAFLVTTGEAADLAAAYHTTRTATRRTEFPLTEAQEIGWYSTEPLIPPTRRFHYPVKRNEITQHAERMLAATPRVYGADAGGGDGGGGGGSGADAVDMGAYVPPPVAKRGSRSKVGMSATEPKEARPAKAAAAAAPKGGTAATVPVSSKRR